MPRAPRGGDMAAVLPKCAATDEAPGSRQLQEEIAGRLGVLPNFFRLPPQRPEITANLWGFAKFAYLDNPLDALFKERLFVYLSRFCDVRYCVIRHVGFLTGLGRPAGDERAPVQSLEETLQLLRRPLPRGPALERHIDRCKAAAAPLPELPPPESEMDEALFACAAHVFLETAEAPDCLAAVRHILGAARSEYLLVLLCFVRTAHYWTRVHETLELEDDVRELLARNDALAKHLLNDPEAESCHISQRLMDELRMLREGNQRQNELADAARENEERLRKTNAELAARIAEARDARQAALNVMEDAIEAKEALADADRRKDEFLATLAHELRNPLAPIRNSVQIMRLAGIDGDVAEQARETIERQVTHLVRLVDDLLDVSRISRNKFELRKERVALAVVIQSAVETSRPLIEASGQEFTVTLPSKTIWVNADLTRLAQAVSNLLNNAAKYTPESGRIRLIVERQGEAVVIRVRDTGIGIPREMRAHIFEMFGQVDTSHERSQGGLGIGLTLVKNLVEMHGGTVEVHSDGPGRGSEFVLRLPVVEARTKASGDKGGDALPGAARRILVVDDNRDSADSLAMLLAHAGHDTHTAHDGFAALEAAESLRPHVILLDIGMPQLNGYEVARRIRQESWGSDIVLIALTGWGQAEDREESRAAGFDDHFVKPVEHTVLAKLLSELPRRTEV
ncbi:MAG TPA: ATP-binding protein [Woeseiaceae bacterium]|nr:ATP-binding protein [Woeseiaceae bacterium]